MQNAILELLADNLPRLNEAEDSDRQGVYHILGTFVLLDPNRFLTTFCRCSGEFISIQSSHSCTAYQNINLVVAASTHPSERA